VNLESKRPPRPLFRVGRDHDAWAVPDWAYAKEDGTFGSRFDDPMRVYRVLLHLSNALERLKTSRGSMGGNPGKIRKWPFEELLSSRGSLLVQRDGTSRAQN
jgi:hypothetical protein